MTVQLIRGGNGRKMTLIKKGDVTLEETDWKLWGNRLYGYE